MGTGANVLVLYGVPLGWLRYRVYIDVFRKHHGDKAK
jgi:hypothetical protein